MQLSKTTVLHCPCTRWVCTHASETNPNAHVHLSARQWLDNYASTHAEMSPMDYKAFLPSGRKVFLLLPVPKRSCWSGMGVSWAIGHLSWGLHLGPATSSQSLLHPREAAIAPLPTAATNNMRPPARRAESASTPYSLGEQSALGGGGTPRQEDTLFCVLCLHRCVSS